MPPNQLAYPTPVTPSTARMRAWYDRGRGNTREVALRVTSVVLAAPSAPAYQASTTVCRKPKEIVATIRPSTVRMERSLWRQALRLIRRSRYMSGRLAEQLAFFQVHQLARL